MEAVEVALEDDRRIARVDAAGLPVLDHRLDVPLDLRGATEKPHARGFVAARRGQLVDEEERREAFGVAEHPLEVAASRVHVDSIDRSLPDVASRVDRDASEVRTTS